MKKPSPALRTLKRRVKVFEKLIAVEELQIKRLRHKSRRIRIGNIHGLRKNWYVDRMQELLLCIEFMEGKITSRKFIHHKLDDAFGQTVTFMGNICQIQVE